MRALCPLCWCCSSPGQSLQARGVEEEAQGTLSDHTDGSAPQDSPVVAADAAASPPSSSRPPPATAAPASSASSFVESLSLQYGEMQLESWIQILYRLVPHKGGEGTRSAQRASERAIESLSPRAEAPSHLRLLSDAQFACLMPARSFLLFSFC